MNSPIIETKDLTKKYGDFTAVDSLNMCINSGDIFGFLGPNGAGKTTTILMLLGLTEPTSGAAQVAGFDCTRDPLSVKRITGYVPEKVGFYEDLTAGYNLKYTAQLNGISDAQANKRIAEALDTVGLPGCVERKVGEFSRGMKQRLAIADILVKAPKIAIMDEPTSGIDPKGIVQMLDMIAQVAKERGMTIVMSSHQLYQVQRICNRVGMLMNGKLVMSGLLDDIGKEAEARSQFKIEVTLTEVTNDIMEAIKNISGVLNLDRQENTMSVSCAEDLRPQIAKAIVEAHGLLIEMKIESYGLEEIYLKYFKEA